MCIIGPVGDSYVGWVSVAADRVLRSPGSGVAGRDGLGWRGVRWACCTLNGARVDCNGSWCVTDWHDARWMVSGSVLRFQVVSVGSMVMGGLASLGVAGGGRSGWLQLSVDIF